jgi:hypothetical protein
MMKFKLSLVGACFATVLSLGTTRASTPPPPGTVNYVEGQASVNGKALTDQSPGTTRLAARQSLSTGNGRAEILLTPGIFFRVGHQSSVEMVSPDLANTSMDIQKGRALVTVASILPENNVQIGEDGATARLLKAGLYDFDADRGQIRVFDGKALVQIGNRDVTVKGGHELNLNADGRVKARKFDKKAYADDFYRWSSLRSAYLAEANVDVARTYSAAAGWAPSPWYGAGWYWDPWFDAYTFIPGGGVFFDPFGWGFYSPGMVFGAPYYGFYGGAYGYGYGHYHHFGPAYRPGIVARGSSAGMIGRAYRVPGNGFGAFSRGGGLRSPSSGVFGRGGIRSGGFGGSVMRGGGLRGGGGFHGGGGRGR